MNLFDAPLGYAFEGDYPESYGLHTAGLRAIVAQQVGRLNGSSAVAEAQLLGILIGRRSADPSRAQVELARRHDDATVFRARGEVVMTPDSYKLGHGHGFLASFRHEARNASVRLRNPQASRLDVDQVIDACAGADVDAWSNYLSTMAAVGKGIGGPENAPDLGDFALYRIPGAPAPGDGPRPRVAVIDTGIQAAPRGDHWLESVTRTPDNIDHLDLLPNGPDGMLDYQAGHGTFVAGIVQRVAPSADIRMYRAADSDGFARDDDIADLIVTAHRDGAEIINLSLGTRTTDDRGPRLMRQAIEQVHEEAGTLADGRYRKVIVAAAGNYGTSGEVWPASFPGVEAVAGLTAYLTPASWSSFGAVRFSAVAEGVHSVFPEGVESALFDPQPDTFPADAGAIWSGTSFAAPQVTGAIARIVAEADVSPRDAVDRLDARGKSVPGFGKAMRILQGIG